MTKDTTRQEPIDSPAAEDAANEEPDERTLLADDQEAQPNPYDGDVRQEDGL